MRVDDVLWLPDMEEKLLVKHGVTTWEAAEGFLNRPRFSFRQRGHVEGEDLIWLLVERTLGAI